MTHIRHEDHEDRRRGADRYLVQTRTGEWLAAGEILSDPDGGGGGN